MAVQSKAYQKNLEKERVLHARHDPHGRVSRLADVILGGQDGLVNALTLFLVGVYKARSTTGGRPARIGLEMALIGILSALVGYGIGLLFRVAPGM